MAFRQRGAVWQVDVTYRGRRRSTSVATAEEARVAEAKLVAELAEEHNQGVDRKRGWTLGYAIDQTTRMVWTGKRSEEVNKRCIAEARDFYGEDEPLEKITTTRVDDYKSALRERGNSSGTINRKLAVLSKVFTFAMERNGCLKKPKLEQEENAAGRIRVVTEEEESRLLSILAQRGCGQAVDAFVCLLDLGCRPSELLGLTPQDVNRVNHTITIWINKTDTPRTIPMTKRVQAIIEPLAKQTKGRLFPRTPEWLLFSWNKARESMGLTNDRDFVPYACRHTCATRLIVRGVPVAHVQAWLGHKDIETTMRYVHLQPSDLMAHVHSLEPLAPAELRTGTSANP